MDMTSDKLSSNQAVAFINAAIFLAVELNDAAHMDGSELDISWWNDGNMEASLYFEQPTGKLTIALNVDVKKMRDKYFPIYGYCKTYDLEYVELFNKL